MKIFKLAYLFLILIGTSFGKDLFDWVMVGNISEAEKLLDSGVDVDTKSRDALRLGYTALMFASRYGNKELVEMLLNRNANVDAKDELKDTALIFASLVGYKEIVKMLLDKNADVNAKNKYGYTALMIASRYGHKEIVKMLLDKNAAVNAKAKDGYTALAFASFQGHKEIVKILIGRGIDGKDIDIISKTALMRNEEEIANILKLEKAIKEGEDLESYIDKLNEEDLLWLLNRALKNEKIENILPRVYKDWVVINKKLKSGQKIEIEELKEDHKGIVEIIKDLKNDNLIKVYELLKDNIEKIRALNRREIPFEVASVITLEY